LAFYAVFKTVLVKSIENAYFNVQFLYILYFYRATGTVKRIYFAVALIYSVASVCPSVVCTELLCLNGAT